MSKELPYFKFNAGEWLLGSISYETLELQGLYIRVCATYWHRDCKFSYKHLIQTFPQELIAELQEQGLLQINNEQLSIRWLDEERDQLTNRKQRLSDAGKKGVEAKRKQATLKPPLSHAQATLKQPEQIRTEQIRTEEDKTKTDLLNSQKWIESVAKNYKFTADQITAHLVSFIHEQSLKGELDRPLKDLKNHFVNVIKKLPPPTFESPFANYAV